MFSSRNEYDRGVNTFSPEGRLLQVEYAMQAIKRGTSAVGIKLKDAVILAVHRKINSILMEPESIEKISEIDSHIACAASGLVTDARTLVEHARVEAQNHRFTFDEPITVKSLTRSVSDLALNFGEGDPNSRKKPTSRPYGVSLLIGGIDETGPCLFQTDPTGTMIKYEAKGIGPAEESIQDMLQESYKEDLPILEAEKLALLCLKRTMEEEINKSNVELCTILKETKQTVFRDEKYVHDIVKGLPQ